MAIVDVEGPPAVAMPGTEELISEDGIPLESPWHRACIALLIEVLTYAWRHRDDFYVGGNMFIYFSAEQARNRDYRGPDFFFVDRVPRSPARPYWAVWLEGFRYPDLIIELTSPSTAEEDRTTKKALYEGTFRTHEYFLHDPETHRTDGWRLGPGQHYQPIVPDQRGWFWSETLGLWLGKWEGSYMELAEPAIWLRYYTADGQLLPLESEDERRRGDEERRRGDEERRRAEDERRRADSAEAELARLKALVAELRRDRPGHDA